MPDLPLTTTAFPFPFEGDSYRYTTNIEPAPGYHENGVGGWGERIIDVDEHYAAEIAERAAILERDPLRCQVLPHMATAAWDVVEYVCEQLATDQPEAFSYVADGDRRHWRNQLLGIDQEFVVGDATTLPLEPFEWITRQIQEDIELLDQREGKLWFDAGILTFGADWSLDFDIGMSFLEIHGPVPRVHETGVLPRANEFLLRLRAGQPYRRTNWTLTVDRRLDTCTETYHEWGPDRTSLTYEEIGGRLHLRVEVQHFVRLPRSGAVMFPIRTYLLSFDEVCAVPAWALRLQRVLATLPQDMVDYKGLTRFRDMAVAWLSARTGEQTPIVLGTVA